MAVSISQRKSLVSVVLTRHLIQELMNPVVNVFTLFHGADHTRDPYQKGIFGSDRLHGYRPGAEQIAKLYRRVGYQYWRP